VVALGAGEGVLRAEGLGGPGVVGFGATPLSALVWLATGGDVGGPL
jgi:hypothetical protein